MAPNAPTAASSRTKNAKNTRASSAAGGAHRSSGGAPEFTLSVEREAELLREGPGELPAADSPRAP
ncbi:hypothetical protein [Sorangium sp. So ce124]|uniref:hypothetical protein n=1 Tax=Sorangium sp. So ce124 TaxID=3133280 RepID=UPI003F62C59A